MLEIKQKYCRRRDTVIINKTRNSQSVGLVFYYYSKLIVNS